MSKLRVHDLAAEFGIASDEVIAMLRALDVVVRSHLTQLTDDQVARARARWEREKRARAAKAAPAASPARRRRTSAAIEQPTEEDERATSDAKPKARAAAKGKVKVKVAPEPEPETAPAGRSTTRRRRAVLPTEAEDGAAVASEGDGLAQDTSAAPIAPEREAVEERVPVKVAPSAVPSQDAVVGATIAPPAPAVPAAPPSVPYSTPDRPRPRSVVPGAPRPRPATSGLPFPPRPVASATPGTGSGGGVSRRDDRRPGGGMGAGAPPAGRRKKGKRGQVDQEAVSANISRTMRQMGGPGPKRRGQRDDGSRDEIEAMRAAAAEVEKKTVRVNEFITVSELADILKIPATQIVSFAFKNLGLMVTINQRLDFDQIELIASEFGFAAQREEEYAAAPTDVVVDLAESLRARPPVVTIMGHVDHGKTSLLDYIRKANVVAGEAGGITQHIGAYHVTTPNGKMVTFLDTPGHEAFTAMRARGAQVTDIVVLVVAADDSIMPQTIEAISHARNAGVPMIVAINKIDLPSANVMKVKQELLGRGVVLEEFGGQTLHSEISAKKGTNVQALLDQILLQAEILDLKANPDRRATGSVVEAQLDAGKGPVATILVQNGTLKVGDDFICGLFSGRVRAMFDERGKPVKDAGPAIPVQVLGMVGVPMAGDQFLVVEDSTEAREIAQRRERLDREARSRRTSKGAVSLEDFIAHAAEGEKRTLKLLIKADQGGPAEALADALAQLSNAEVQVEVIQRGVGAITEGDILLAKAAGAIIIGFHVRPDNKARSAAERENVEIKLYKIIYEAVADVRAALEGMLRPDEREVIFGEAEVRNTFKVSKIGTIAGCFVRSGVINRQGRVRVIRDGKEVYDGIIGSLRRFKDDVKEVKDGFECGIGVENFNDVKVGDVFECYRKEIVARTLVSAPA
ncbi:MAG TPA: translation initiation factor IF-2 [Gemmatimonadaceae bacterium]|nr:translation initiation factor IF-2 [Gemmatimonadaceae bacterium]